MLSAPSVLMESVCVVMVDRDWKVETEETRACL